ncbi:MAG: methylated-DNA--[protein]-cysteine S-methyltransferase [Acidobacteria bacterium]|nr:methylated-DNA--[protein]-cysteine S-methyltransferase [Acidobacteriota bacterium]
MRFMFLLCHNSDKEVVNRLCSQELESSVGTLVVAGSPQGLCRICFSLQSSTDSSSWFNRHFSCLPEKGWQPTVNKAIEQLSGYFEGKRRVFEMPLDLRGTAFQLRVWNELLKIPYGSTVSYGEVARRIGKPRASQAVGAAVGRNPVPIVVPCHRVIGQDGSLVGFAGGLATKEKLLELEGWVREG